MLNGLFMKIQEADPSRPSSRHLRESQTHSQHDNPVIDPEKPSSRREVIKRVHFVQSIQEDKN